MKDFRIGLAGKGYSGAEKAAKKTLNFIEDCKSIGKAYREIQKTKKELSIPLQLEKDILKRDKNSFSPEEQEYLGL